MYSMEHSGFSLSVVERCYFMLAAEKHFAKNLWLLHLLHLLLSYTTPQMCTETAGGKGKLVIPKITQLIWFSHCRYNKLIRNPYAEHGMCHHCHLRPGIIKKKISHSSCNSTKHDGVYNATLTMSGKQPDPENQLQPRWLDFWSISKAAAVNDTFPTTPRLLERSVWDIWDTKWGGIAGKFSHSY